MGLGDGFFFFFFNPASLKNIKISQNTSLNLFILSSFFSIFLLFFFFLSLYKSNYILVNENQDYIARQKYLRLPCDIFKR